MLKNRGIDSTLFSVTRGIILKWGITLNIKIIKMACEGGLQPGK